MLSDSQIMAEYHRRILRIPHGNQNPTKRYLNNEEVLEVFDGEVWIQEKVDGKLTPFDNSYGQLGMLTVRSLVALEDMTGKNTVHNHVMTYNDLPEDKRIILDTVTTREVGKDNYKTIFSLPLVNLLTYARINLDNPTIAQIHIILEAFSQMRSHFGSNVIEGLVIKNYRKQLMAKWINEYFEDRLP